MDWESVTFTTTENKEEILMKSGLEAPENSKITLPTNVFIEQFAVNFGTARKVCEIVIGGIKIDDYECTAGFYKHNKLCVACPKGKYQDVAGELACKTCDVQYNLYSDSEASKSCAQCPHLQFSTGTECTSCHAESIEPMCFGYKGYDILSVNLDLAFPELVTTDVDDLAAYSLSVATTVTLDMKYVSAIAIVVADSQASVNIPECEESSLTYPSNNKYRVYNCTARMISADGGAMETFTLEPPSGAVTIDKLFVFGDQFSTASVPQGYFNDGTKIQQCEPGSFSVGGSVATCTSCPQGQVQPQPGSSACDDCEEGQYSDTGRLNCLPCRATADNTLCANLENMCHDVQETGSKLHQDQEVYIYGREGQPYKWPMTPKLGTASFPCHYNPEESATKKCKENLEFEKTNFDKCKTKVTDEIDGILDEANSIEDDDDREAIARNTKELVEQNSPVMNNDNVDTTADIIDKLVDSTPEGQELSEPVRDNILSTVDYVHLETRKEEIAKGTTAKKMRGSVSKVINKLAASSTSSYLTRPSVGVSVSPPRAGTTSFAITGDPADISKTERREGEPGLDEDVIFEVSVPADTGSSTGVTAAFYTTDKFYPDPALVSDPKNSLGEMFLGNATNTNPTKVVSMVTDISYAGTEKRKKRSVTFPEGDVITLSYYLEKPEEPRVHYKMPLMTEYKCAYYNTDQNSWVGTTESGCVKEEVDVGDGRKKVTCKCNHMTSFAVLMSFGSDYDPVEEVVSYVLLAISLGCLLCTLIAYLPAKEMLKTRTVRLNLLLVTSMICSIIVFYFMEVVVAGDISEGSVKRETDSASIQCVLIAFLMNYFWLCQMAWMVCEAVVMYRALVSCVVNSHIHRYMLKFNLACWGIPLIFPIAGVIWGQDQYANPRTCFLRPLYGFATFYAPVVMAVLFNIFIFLRVGWSISRNENMGTKVPVSDLERRKKQFKFAVTVMSLLGVAWVFGFFLIIEQLNQIWLRYLFILTNSTQGIFIFILYVVLNDNLKKVWKKLLGISEGDKPSNSSVPYSRSKGMVPTSTKQTTFSNSASAMESPRGGGSGGRCVTLVSEGERSRSTSPRSTKMTTSLMGTTVANNLHIYDNVARVMSDSYTAKNTKTPDNRYGVQPTRYNVRHHKI